MISENSHGLTKHAIGVHPDRLVILN